MRFPRRILIIDGHPDPDAKRFCHALADAYAEGAAVGGHEVRRVNLSGLEFPFLGRRDDWETQASPAAVADVQADIVWAQHLLVVYPLWLGSMPARLKALWEQALRPGFAVGQRERTIGGGHLKGRTARVVVTMGMPAPVYRIFYGAHSLRAFERNILGFVGIGPMRSTLIGNVEGIGSERCERWLDRLYRLGRGGL